MASCARPPYSSSMASASHGSPTRGSRSMARRASRRARSSRSLPAAPQTPHGPERSPHYRGGSDRLATSRSPGHQLERAEQAVAACPLFADFLPRAQVQLDRERIRRCTALVRLRLFGHRSGDRAASRRRRRADRSSADRDASPTSETRRRRRSAEPRSGTPLLHVARNLRRSVDAELCSDLARVAVGALEAHHDAARAQSQAARHRQRVDQLLGESVGEIVVVHGATVAKRQYCESLGPAPNAHIGARNHVCGTT